MINKIEYNNSNDCSGNPSSTQNFCKSNSFQYDICTEICDKSDCNGISITIYSTVNCTDNILNKNNHLPKICLRADKYTCSNGQIQYIGYARYNTPNINFRSVDCSGNPIETTKYDLGCNGYTKYAYAGCNHDMNDTKDIDSCTVFDLFGAAILLLYFLYLSHSEINFLFFVIIKYISLYRFFVCFFFVYSISYIFLIV